ncbi:MAG: LysR family transcriptional regulator [Acutalibacteraceae bacterium]
MDLKQLSYFVAVAEEGSISKAAKKLYMTQPPLSIQIKKLEQEIGSSLFERGGKIMRLTHSGKLLYERADAILESVRSAQNEVRANAAGGEKTVKIGIVSSVVSFAARWISGFFEKNPTVRFEITEGNTYGLIEGMKSGAIDAAIVRTPCNTEDFGEILLITETVTAAGNAGLFDNNETVNFEYLSKRPLIVYRRWADIIEKQALKSGIRLIPKFVCDDARTAVTLAENCGGICIVPESADIPLDKNIIRRRISDCKVSSSVKLIFNTADQTEHMKKFTEYMKRIGTEQAYEIQSGS